MNSIKFSHEYSKFPFVFEHMDRTVLLETFVKNKSELSECFIVVDTHIRGRSIIEKESYYPLPEGKLLILLLKTFHNFDGIHESHGIWTTIRRWTPEKEDYYNSLRGKQINIELIK